MWRFRGSDIDVKKVWAEEEAMSKRARRRRYRRGAFMRLKNVEPWTVALVPLFPEIHTVAPQPVVDEKQDHAVDAQSSQPIDDVPTESKPVEVVDAAVATPASDVAVDGAQPDETPQPAPKNPNEQPSIENSDEESDEELDDAPIKTYQPDASLNRLISVWRGDITTLEIDAIVNAANKSLLGGGGVDGAIHSAAGERLYDECLTLNGGETGQTKITRGYNLPAKYVLHTVGPIGENPEKLTSCYKTCLDLALKHNLRSIAFCGISTGIYGYPLEPATRIAVSVVREWLETDDNKSKVDRIIFCTFLEREQSCYTRIVSEYFPPAYDPEFLGIYDQMKAEESEPEEESAEEADEDEASDSDDSDSDDNDSDSANDIAEPLSALSLSGDVLNNAPDGPKPLEPVSEPEIETVNTDALQPAPTV